MHIEAISRSQPEELKSIISVEEKLQWKSIGSTPPPLVRIHAAAGKSKRVPTMPKRYLPYQVESRAGHQTTKAVKKEKVVQCKSVGSNGLVFTSDGDRSSEEDSDEVDVESCDNNSILDGDRKSVVTLNSKDEEMKEPTRRKTPTLSKEEEGGCSPPANHANTMAFVAILLHALKCSSCEKPACRKMIMVLQHYKQCAFKRKVSLSEGSTAGQNCKICAQLLRIVALHAKNDCKMHPTQMGCPVLMCDTFRLASYANKKVQQPNVKKIEAVDAKRGVTIGRRVVVTQQPN